MHVTFFLVASVLHFVVSASSAVSTEFDKENYAPAREQDASLVAKRRAAVRPENRAPLSECGNLDSSQGALVPVCRAQGRQLSFLGGEVETPRTFRPLDLETYLEAAFRKRFAEIYDQLVQGAARVGAKPIESQKALNHAGSALFYSTDYGIRLFVTANLRDYTIFSGHNLRREVSGVFEEHLVNEFIDDLNRTVGTASVNIVRFQSIREYLDDAVIGRIESTKTLKTFLEIYEEHHELFEEICETGKYGLLVTENIFQRVLADRFKGNTKANIALCHALLAWEDLHTSFKLTCMLGAGEGRMQQGKEFYESFLEPFLGILLTDPAANFEAVTSFSKDDFHDPGFKDKRFHVVKFRTEEGWPNPLAIAVCGYRADEIAPSSTQAVEQPKTSSCAVM